MSSLFVMSFRDAKNLVVVLSKTLFPAEKNYNNGTAFESAQHYLPDSSTARTIRPSFEKKNIFLYDSSSKTTMTPKITNTDCSGLIRGQEILRHLEIKLI